jgi:agmatinase
VHVWRDDSFKPGTRFGPRAIRDQSFNFEPYIPDYRVDLSELPVHDMGDLDLPVVAETVVDLVEEAVGQIVRDGKVPVLLGGEHTVTVGAVRAVKPDVFVVCDAHLDLREEYRGAVYNHGCSTRLVYEGGVREIVILGARSGTRDQYKFAERLHLYPADEIRAMGIKAVITDVKRIIGSRKIYLSIDADVIDGCLTPGLGTPEPFGITPQDVRELVAALAPTASAFDYVEVCPCDQGQTASVAAQIVRTFLASHWSSGQHG